ncbi:hypothetical protein EPN52_08940 [bacterium]|nr:MAG: hypothetical protein EPN52_08940 [bacterium]
MSEAVMERPTTDFVTHEAGRLQCVLVIPPDAGFERVRPIKGEGPPISARAAIEHQVFVRTLESNRVEVVELRAAAHLGMATLVRSTAIMLAGGAVIGRLTDPERRGEEEAVRALLEQRGIPVLGAVEGPGALDARDVVLMGDRIVAAKTRATNAAGLEQLERIAHESGLTLREVTLARGVSHLGDVFSVLDTQLAVAVPALVRGDGLEGVEIVALPRESAGAADCLTLAPRLVVMDLRNAAACAVLKRRKIAVEAIDLYDFGRAGAGPSALALPLRRAPLR